MTIDAVLARGLDALLNPAAARRKAARQLPEIVAREVRKQMTHGKREHLSARLTNDVWPAVQKGRGPRWEPGWAELTAGIALAIELLQDELPRALHEQLRGTPAEQEWLVARRPFQRFVLLVDSTAHVRRVFAAPAARPPSVPVERSQEWAVDGPQFRDRSHTLMLALMADAALHEDLGPTAATGELLDDGERVGPVGGLVEKAAAWRRLHPEGLLISAPPGDLDARTWTSLARPPQSSSGDCEPDSNWVVGVTLSEIKAKLSPAHLSVESWDGRPLVETSLVAPRFAQEVAPPEQHFGDTLLDAAWAAFRAARNGGERRGVLIHGAPGSGKSVLTRTLERRFSRGALGAFGLGVRCGAREVADELDRAPSASWSDVLAARDQRTELLRTLEKTRRLVPIVDGLDELQPHQLERVSNWLRAGSGWWIATSRPLRAVGAELPVGWEVRLEDLRPHEAHKLLVDLGRRDLAEAAVPAGSQTEASATFRELTRTPLHTALLAKVVPRGGDLHLQPNTLYAYVFEALLEHACKSGRLRVAEAGLVRQLLGTVVGELALAWLQSTSGRLDHGAINDAFERIDLGPLEQVDAIDALAFGHLLVRVGAGWDFAHRTIAEWTAATALRRRVQQSPHRGAQVELDVLSPYLEDGVLPHQGRWATLLRFYAPFVSEPIALLDRLVGPKSAPTWRVPERSSRWNGDASPARPSLRRATSTEVLESWSFAYELLRLCPWTRAVEARTAWALAARRWLLPAFDERPHSEGLPSLRAFSEAVAEHLPTTLEGLVALAARTEAQKSLLTTDPLVLLPAIPAARAPALSALLAHGTRAQQLAVLEWYRDRKLEPPRPTLDRLACEAADELERVANVSAAEPERSREAEDVLGRLEAAVWSTFLRCGREPPSAVVRRRFAAWPWRLNEQLTTWFGAAATDEWSTTSEDAVRRRREFLAALLNEAASGEEMLARTLASIGDARRRCVIGRLRYFFDDGDERKHQRIVERIAATRGWGEDRAGWTMERREIAEEQVAVELRQAVERMASVQTRISRLIGTLDDAGLDGVVGELWSLLSPEHAGRREILLALDGQERIPAQLPAAEILRHRGSAGGSPSRIRWTDKHLEQLRQLSHGGVGRQRFDAVCALARATKGDEVTELQQHLATGDEAFVSLVYGHVARLSRCGDERVATLALPDPSRLPLADRAVQDVPGWRAELIARLADVDDDEIGTLAEIAGRKDVRDALPLLAQRLSGNEWRDRPIIEAIALLATEQDAERVRPALHQALRLGWPDGRPTWRPLAPRESDTSRAGAELARFFRIDDLDVLAEGEVSALSHPSLAAAIRALGPEAIARLVALHEAAKRRIREFESLGGAEDVAAAFEQPAAQQLARERRRRDALAETIVASLDPSAASLAQVVNLLFRIGGADVHHVHSVPGPLGSDFDEPGDMDWHSHQENEAFIGAAVRVIDESLGHHPAEWVELRRLFGHPSESLRKRAFELCADRAAPHEVAALAMEALEGHERENRTRWSGQLGGLLLAGHRSGAGSFYVESPDTGRSLVAAVRARLTPAHKDVVRALTAHPLPVFRRLAAKWAGELGRQDWVEFVVPLLDDAEPGVVSEAIGAIATLAPSGLDRQLAGLACEQWTTEHDVAVLRRLEPTREPATALGTERGEAANLSVHVSESTLAKLLSGASVRASAGGAEARGEDACFRGFPSLVERVLSEWPRPLGRESADLFRAWIEQPNQLVRNVGRRQLAVRGLLDASALKSLLGSTTPAERLSGAECVVRMGLEPLRSEALHVLRGALVESPDEHDLGAVAIVPPTEKANSGGSLRSDALGDSTELGRRLLWALRGATPAFAEAIELIANRLPYDDAEGCLEREAEEIVSEVTRLTRRWGADGAIALLGLVDRGEVEADYTFLSEIRRAAERHAEVLAAVREGAARGGSASASVLEDLNDGEFDRDLGGLARRLTEEVFPPQWPDRSAWQ